MKKFCVVIEETVSEEFEVEAENKDDAIKKTIKKYKSGELVLEQGELQYKQMAIINDNDEIDEWIEF